jgi:3-isopropylmalate/(R)-2-methylmalate dehydratase small subunit
MKPIKRIEGNAAVLPLANIDTDQLLPARFLKVPRAEGYSRLLLHDLRFDENGRARPDFPLNTARGREATILVAGRNFGGGSSREGAVYALVDFGINCVIAPSFGDIFAGNATNNALLTAVVTEADAEALSNSVERSNRAVVDLRDCQITVGDLSVSFTIDPVRRKKLLNGWDDIDMTKSYAAEIGAFVARDNAARPWVLPDRRGAL